MANELIVLHFVKEKDTKNTVRFTEVPEEGKPPVVGTVYLQKWAVTTAQALTITIERKE